MAAEEPSPVGRKRRALLGNRKVVAPEAGLAVIFSYPALFHAKKRKKS